MSEAEPVALLGEPMGSARIIHTVLNEKIEEAPWKERTLAGIGRKVVCVHFIDRENDSTMIFKTEKGELAVQNHEPKPHVTVKLPQKKFYNLLKIPQGPLNLPALYKGGGWEVTKLLANRTIVVKGLLLHPIVSIRVLKVLAVPPDAK
ncbi:hypothetical protein [Sporichthya sp.]|uniref:hypothetical protein n=1 Tax=Sporichthya sp. TaxID=65475 RepID=UPI001853B490|nr:hypothetical protein [Sporichthya sp.]MBA3742194.1 hypothetical protein [Sporichthya sp.]